MPPSFEQKLVAALLSNDEANIKHVLSSKRAYSVNSFFTEEPYMGSSLLTFAAEAGCYGAVKALIKNGADANLPDARRYPPVVAATLFEDPDPRKRGLIIASIFQALLSQNINITFVLDDGASLLCLLAQDGLVEAAEILLRHAPVLLNQTRKDGVYPLMLAAQYDHLNMVRLLIKHKANPNLKNCFGETALAAAIGHKAPLEVIAALFDGDIKPDVNVQDNEGTTPLILACQEERTDLIEFLLAKNANAAILGKDNNLAAISIAAQTGKFGIIKLLRGQPFATGLRQHPCFILCLIKLDNPTVFEMIVKELISQGYGFKQSNFKIETYITIKPEHSWKYEILKKHGASFTLRTEDNGQIGVLLSTHPVSLVEQNIVKVLKIEREESNLLLSTLLSTAIDNKMLLVTNNIQEWLIAVTQVIPQEMQENTAEKLSLDSLFYKILNFQRDLLEDGNVELSVEYFTASTNFFRIIPAVAELAANKYATFTALKFYFAACLFYLDANKPTEVLANLQMTMGLLSYKELDVRHLNTIIDTLNLKSDPEFLEKAKEVLAHFLQKINNLEKLDALGIKIKLDFTLKYIKFLDNLRKVYEKTNVDPPKALIKETLGIISVARNDLSKLGKKYFNYVKNTRQLNEYEFNYLFKSAIDSKDPQQVKHALDLLNKSDDSLPEKIQRKAQLESLIPPQNKHTHQNRAEKTTATSAAEPESGASSSEEDVNKKIELLRADSERIEAQERVEAQRRLQLRKEHAERMRDEKASSARQPAPQPKPAIELRWSEAEIRKIYAAQIRPEDKLIALTHPSNAPLGTFWACLTVEKEAFADPDEYDLYLGKFNEGRVRTDDKDSGIVCVNDIYYLRVQGRLPRVHADNFKCNNGPTFLKFSIYMTHNEHLRFMKAPPASGSTITSYATMS
jgi:ankyrin repeat protein